MDWPLLLGAWTAHFIGVASPGPAIVAVMSAAMSVGRRQALFMALGVFTGSATWALLSLAGVTALLTHVEGGVWALRVFGGCYLIWLAYKKARSALAPGDARFRAVETEGDAASWRRGLLIHLSNPKAVLFWTAIVSLGVAPGVSHAQTATLIAGCLAISASLLLVYALAFSTPAAIRVYLRARRPIEAVFALIFGAAGLALLAVRP